MRVKTRGALENMAKLLQVDAGAAEKALGKRVVSANQELLEIGHTLDQARYGRDAFAKVRSNDKCKGKVKQRCC